MRFFILSVFAASAVAAYAGDMANSSCSWTLSGYVCASGPALAAATSRFEGRV
jgi:hypothetical protein